jgi:single-stranded DNA-binding protein
MSSAGLNKWIVSGNLAADAEVKTVELRNGEKARVAKATLYVQKPRHREEAFTVSLSIWEGSAAWRRLPFLKKGSLIICTGSVEPTPYISSHDNKPKAGLSMSVIDIDLDNVRKPEEEEDEQILRDVLEISAEANPQATPTQTRGHGKNTKGKDTPVNAKAEKKEAKVNEKPEPAIA